MIDPAQGSALGGAVDWIRTLLLGSIGTAVAILAVALVGGLMLTGRIPVGRGVSVILGCFVLFSAGVIADGLLGTAGRPTATIEAGPSVPETVYAPTAPKPAPYDPYAGASVPTRRPEEPNVR